MSRAGPTMKFLSTLLLSSPVIRVHVKFNMNNKRNDIMRKWVANLVVGAGSLSLAAAVLYLRFARLCYYHHDLIRERINNFDKKSIHRCKAS